MKVGYLGPDQVTFGFEAAELHFNGQERMDFEARKSHAEICKCVGKQELDFGVVACENYIDGAISETVRAVDQGARMYGVHICGEVIVPIEHYLLCKDVRVEPTKVLSHPSALRQCSKYLEGMMMRGVTVEAVESTGMAAKMASENPSLFAVGSRRAQEIYGLTRLEEGSIADLAGNMTRFWILGKSYAPRTGRDKTAFAINLEQDSVGVVYNSLGFFANRDISLLWMHANPVAGRHWEYTFLVEFQGHIGDEDMTSAYEGLTSSGLVIGGPTLLGSWPDKTSAA